MVVAGNRSPLCNQAPRRVLFFRAALLIGCGAGPCSTGLRFSAACFPPCICVAEGCQAFFFVCIFHGAGKNRKWYPNRRFLGKALANFKPRHEQQGGGFGISRRTPSRDGNRPRAALPPSLPPSHSQIVVLDGLVDEKLSKDLLDLVTEPGWATSREAGDGTNSKRPSPRKAPPLSKWERGLSDVESDTTAPGGRGAGAGSWGLTNDGMEWLCREGKHPAVVEVGGFGARERETIDPIFFVFLPVPGTRYWSVLTLSELQAHLFWGETLGN